MSAAILALRLAPAFPWLIPACGLLAIAETSGWIDVPLVGGAFKPLTTLLIILHAMHLPGTDARRRLWVLRGLGLSFLGECGMAVPEGFVPGLYLFVLAQCCYLTALMGRNMTLARPGPMHLVHGIAVAWALAMWSARPLAIFLPAALFMCMLGLVSAQADMWWWRSRGTAAAAAARCAALGCLFWMSADLLWTYSQFVQWIPETFAIVLTLYWLAQWHLASFISAGSDEPTRGV